jgi:hypothetical protein
MGDDDTEVGLQADCIPGGRSAASKCGVYGLEQNRVTEWFEQESGRALFERSLANALFLLTGDEYDRNRPAPKLQFPLKLDSRHTRHYDVKQQTAGLAQAARREKLGR